MVNKLYYKGEEKGRIVNGDIAFRGLDLNEFLDEVLGNIVEVETEDGNVIFERKVAPIDQKLIYLTQVLGFEIKETGDVKEKKSKELDLGHELVDYLTELESKVLNYVQKEVSDDKLMQIKSDIVGLEITENDILMQNIEVKSVDDIIKILKSLLSFEAFKQLSYSYVKHNFLSGAEDSEEDINKLKPFNYVPDRDAISYIGEYTFDNIKGMSDDIANSLRVQLQIGFMNGEGISKLKERVKSVFDVSENRAKTIARTESARAHHFGRLNAWNQSGVKAKKWLLMTDDDRTSDVSKALNHKYGTEEQAIPLEDNFKVNVKVGKKIVTIDQPCGPFHPSERDELMIFPVVEDL